MRLGAAAWHGARPAPAEQAADRRRADGRGTPANVRLVAIRPHLQHQPLARVHIEQQRHLFTARAVKRRRPQLEGTASGSSGTCGGCGGGGGGVGPAAAAEPRRRPSDGFEARGVISAAGVGSEWRCPVSKVPVHARYGEIWGDMGSEWRCCVSKVPTLGSSIWTRDRCRW